MGSHPIFFIMKKKLGLTDADAALDQAIIEVGSKMKTDHTKNRATFYYMLAKIAGEQKEKYNRKESIVDLMKLLKLDSSPRSQRAALRVLQRLMSPDSTTCFIWSALLVQTPARQWAAGK